MIIARIEFRQRSIQVTLGVDEAPEGPHGSEALAYGEVERRGLLSPGQVHVEGTVAVAGHDDRTPGCVQEAGDGLDWQYGAWLG